MEADGDQNHDGTKQEVTHGELEVSITSVVGHDHQMVIVVSSMFIHKECDLIKLHVSTNHISITLMLMAGRKETTCMKKLFVINFHYEQFMKQKFFQIMQVVIQFGRQYLRFCCSPSYWTRSLLNESE